MKKVATILISTILFSGYCSAETVTTPDASDAAPVAAIEKKEAATLSLGNGLEIKSTEKHEEDAQLPYTIDVNYPQISGANLSAGALEFNRQISEMVNSSVQKFKNYVKADMPHMQTLPESVKHNSLRIDYDIDVIKPANETLISVRLSIEGMQAGRAHPYHQHQVLNFNLSKNKALALKDLFKANANYLSVIAKYANKTLNTKLQDKWMINDGTAPVLKNYQLWNLESDDLLITFGEYQVAPYVYGTQEVEIPYSELSSVIAPQSSIAPCVKEVNSCALEK